MLELPAVSGLDRNQLWKVSRLLSVKIPHQDGGKKFCLPAFSLSKQKNAAVLVSLWDRQTSCGCVTHLCGWVRRSGGDTLADAHAQTGSWVVTPRASTSATAGQTGVPELDHPAGVGAIVFTTQDSFEFSHWTSSWAPARGLSCWSHQQSLQDRIKVWVCNVLAFTVFVLLGKTSFCLWLWPSGNLSRVPSFALLQQR